MQAIFDLFNQVPRATWSLASSLRDSGAKEARVVENPDSVDFDANQFDIRHRIDLRGVLYPQERSALLILNQELRLSREFLQALWDSSGICVCADGGANRLHDFFIDERERAQHLPAYIVGDLDSLRDDVRAFYEGHGVVVLEQSTQYASDLMKSVQVSSLHFNHEPFRACARKGRVDTHNGVGEMIAARQAAGWTPEPLRLLVLNAIDGRFDLTVHSVAQMYTLREQHPYLTLFYITPTDLLFLVPADGTCVSYTSDMRAAMFGCCGLLPLGGSCTLRRTYGLKWDVCAWDTSIAAGRVSSSNYLVGDTGCYVDADRDILMSIELRWNGVDRWYTAAQLSNHSSHEC
ncbi:AFR387Cp [Eremothecium gossypii ATCC 10895]|uniref:Thiamine pyrophosphokinase n=1 Tax=Eremothecium gossypii (strain ATCC 10895 / CBS 109.51 / FGSC 9923 / NRRL Y-1056) TaxID=284811 RepID=Q753C9_EREGS|nr:AFR387Cp [Eremothecium gossypii ATCC 10895]AAS53758.1 AFR387Cp [Eremothecium gossypii ATCC 10895]